jgi:hypothetical protein
MSRAGQWKGRPPVRRDASLSAVIQCAMIPLTLSASCNGWRGSSGSLSEVRDIFHLLVNKNVDMTF